MGKDQLSEAFASIKIDAPILTKLMKQSFKKDEVTHQVRIFFKRLKAHIVLAQALGSTNIQLSDTLRTYYQKIGMLRDAHIFRELCKTYTHKNKLIMVLGEEQVVKAKQKVEAYKQGLYVKPLVKELVTLTDTIIATLDSFDHKRIHAGLETYIEQTENLLHQLLQSDSITNVGIHTIRKHIKKVMYLLEYMCLLDKTTYKPIQKKYQKFAEKLGSRNDLQLFVGQLESLPWTGKEEKIITSLITKEQKLKKKILKKLRMYFHVLPRHMTQATEWVVESEKPGTLLQPIDNDTQKQPSRQSAPKTPRVASTTTKRKPTTTKRKPTTTKRKPTTTKRKPTTTKRKPTTTNKTVSTKTSLATTPVRKKPVRTTTRTSKKTPSRPRSSRPSSSRTT